MSTSSVGCGIGGVAAKFKKQMVSGQGCEVTTRQTDRLTQKQTDWLIQADTRQRVKDRRTDDRAQRERERES